MSEIMTTSQRMIAYENRVTNADGGTCAGSMGSIISGLNYNTRVCDLIEQFDFPRVVKDDAKRIAFDLEKKFTPKMMAIVCLYVSSDINNYDFKNSMDDIINKYNDEFHSLKPIDNNIKRFIYDVRKRASSLDVGEEIQLLMSLKDRLNSTECNDSALLLGSPNREGQSCGKVVMSVLGV